MYTLRPITTFDAPIELSTCMYSLKNIHAEAENGLTEKSPPPCMKNLGSFKQVEQFLKNIEIKEMAELEDRQEKLLNQLEELKKIMQAIKSNLKLSSSTSNISSCSKKTSNSSTALKVDDIPDIVINANPLYPPYFLVFLQRLLHREVSLNVNCFVHSSVSKVPSICEAIATNLKTLQTKGIPSLNVSLIWKEIGPNAELSMSHFPIQGEANILRYLDRVLDRDLSYEKNPNPEKIDYFLDLSYKLSNTKSKICRSSILQSLSNSISKTKWLGGQSVTIADIAMYDSLKKFASSNELNGSLNNWFSQCEQYFKL